MLSQKDYKDLTIFSAKIRRETVKAITAANGGHIGGAMSMVEALAVLYGKLMRIDPAEPRMEERDRFILSKGHSGPSLYATLALKGFFPMEMLNTLNRGDTSLPSHCDRNKTPGVDFSTGSLGQGISMAAGSALGARLMQKHYTTFCILGDGECDEGQVWEAALFAAQQKLDDLIVLVDANKMQLDGKTDDICGLGDLSEKFRDFGWFVQSIDGHDLYAIYDALLQAKAYVGKPAAIILNTQKGHGCEYALRAGNCHHMAIPVEACDKEVARLDKLIQTMEA